MRKTYLIADGVRRAKAAQLAGHDLIWAKVAGREEEDERKIRVASLRSPKKRIELQLARERDRWISICNGMAEEPDLFPPIIIKLSTRGIPVAEVVVIDEGALEYD